MIIKGILKYEKIYLLRKFCGFVCFNFSSRACIRRPLGARSLDGVKRRVRAGMGRCQGGFCSPRVMDILSRELGLPMEKITKSGGRSNIVLDIHRGEGQ